MDNALRVVVDLGAIIGVCLPLYFVLYYLDNLSAKLSNQFLIAFSAWTDRKLAQAKAAERERWARQGRASSNSEK